MTYEDFIERKTQIGGDHGFDPLWMPDQLFDFQKSLVEWATRKGRAAIFADCGLGKTFMQLVWAENVVRKTNGKVLILTPLAVASQTIKESIKIEVHAHQSRTGKFDDSAKIIVTNYEKLHLFNPDDFIGCVCDESSILKHFTGATQQAVTRFIGKMPYRLLCTATAAPNDYIELGTSSQALSELQYSEMLTRFFRQLDDKGQKQELMKQAEAEKVGQRAPQYYQRLAYRIAQSIGQWRLKNHAVDDFWRWVASWARACRMPSDLGFSDKGFILPELNEIDHIIAVGTPPEGMLFCMPALGLGEERDERRRTLKDRCEFVANTVDHDDAAVIWCHMNDEGDALEEMIDGSMQVAGKTLDDQKEEIYRAFQSGELKKIIIKPKIGAWGLNWQHCNHVVTFASHSYEQYYQSVRRCWRFGQMRPVRLDVIATEGEARVVANMRRKARQADLMFSKLVEHMNASMRIKRENRNTKKVEVPSWL